MRPIFLCISKLRVASGPRMKLAGSESALNVILLTFSKAAVSAIVLLFVALWFILRGDLFIFFFFCYFVLVVVSPFSTVITSLLGRES